ncbi:hypothetical protein G7068_12160 [Leucobacter viscericola]|uniref:SLH domain-containing protein n=1 Tax=Leucobacter viscericola TaxID=2714935 RepID=A0A6G7XH41_9MICO|nr:putative Ig domain-containing protein [Leucobacter viscericola]QIK63863.1 hypothetical protein G7068_12160 [Leucobacter viscericola]
MSGGLAVVLLGSGVLLAGTGAATAVERDSGAGPAVISPGQGPQEGGTAVTLPAPSALTFTQAVSGEAHTVALGDDGNTYAWGYNAYGQLGDGTVQVRNVPARVKVPAGVTFTQIAARGFFTVGLGDDGNTYAWGSNQYGQLGDGTTTHRNLPVLVQAPSGVKFTRITTGYNHTVAQGDDGNTYAWGLNASGQLGDGSNTDRNVPELVQASSQVKFTQVEAGYNQTLAVGTDGNTYAWGQNSSGQLGDGTTTDRNVPGLVQTPSGVAFTQIAAGGISALAVGDDGNTYAWGSNGYGQLGDGTTAQRIVPTPVQSPSGVTFTQISAGSYSSAALGDDGNAYGWGNNFYGRLGDGTSTQREVPTLAQLPSGVTFKRITAATDFTTAVGADGNVYAWGQYTYGRLGDGIATASRKVPGVVPTNDVVTGVLFDGVAGADFVHNADGTLTVVTPAHAPGAVDVSIEMTRYGVVLPPLVYPSAYTYVAPVKVSITTGSLPAGRVSASYSAVLAATGTAPFAWSVTNGNLPDGLKLDRASGKLSGVPTKAGTFKFTVTVEDSAGSASKVFSITVKQDDVTACVAPRKVPVFADTPLSHKFYKEIDWMECMKYSTGWRQPVGKPLYKPQDNLERQAMAAFIFRMEAPKGYKAPKVSPFADVKPGDSFYTEMAWMYEKGYATGWAEPSGKPTYRPHEPLSREAMAAFIYRLEASTNPAAKNYKAPAKSPMADMKPGMKFYKEISWMYSEGLSTGNKVGNTKEYWPKDDLSRQAMAAFIYRLVTDYRATK